MSDAPDAKSGSGKGGSHLVSKPWLLSPSPRVKVSYWLVYGCILLGFLGGVAQCIVTYFNVSRNRLDNAPMCLVLEEDFSNAEKALGPKGTFQHEVSLSGFGNGQFDMSTSSPKNSWVDEEKGWLYIQPTLTADEDLGNGKAKDGLYVYNLTDCTFNETAKNGGFIDDPRNPGQQVYDLQGYLNACSAVSNATSGDILPPAQSARITTRKTASIKHGRVEVRARMPRGDWLWPAIWMLPTNNVYGDWPRSGEIDIVESRGNGLAYTARGRNYVQGALNWGPTPELNAVGKSYSWWSDKRVGYDEDFHTYVLEWTEKWIRIYVDTRLHTLLEFRFPTKPGGLFKFGDFPENIVNSTTGQLGALQDPWQGNNAGPFDEDFYLILNVAVGGTNGWFPEVQGDKPWLNQAGQERARKDFALARNRWLPSWLGQTEKKTVWGDKSAAMVVDSVKMWKHC
ncbi:concanavalin A-like lectin/glucanase [Marasmius fiardii PR-910]|nr:concanavalin A-like lectin/glucanase [Marasmius fiardii PR-910]